MSESQKDDIAFKSEIFRDIQLYQEIIDQGNPFIAEFFHNNIKNNLPLIEERMDAMEKERQIYAEGGRVDEHLINDIKTLNALFEVHRMMERYKQYEKTKSNVSGITLV